MLILDWILLWVHGGGGGGCRRGGGGGFLLWVICGFMVVAGGFWVLIGWVTVGMLLGSKVTMGLLLTP